MRQRIFLLTLLTLSAILTGSWFYVSNSKTTILPVSQSGQIQIDGKNGVFGKVLIGPTCPVVTPGQKGCEDKPVEAEIIVLTRERSKEIGRFKTDRDGNYKITLPPGTYSLEPSPQKTGISRGMPQIVTIEADKFVELNLRLDSGIR